MLGSIPVTPDGDTAREWIERELGNPRYRDAEATLLDRMAKAIGDFFRDLFAIDPSGALSPLAAVVTVGLIVVIVVVALLIWGIPRASRRSRAQAGTLFGEVEHRSAAQLRAAADAAAAGGDWEEAIGLRFRALARSLTERGVLEIAPGATVHAFARLASDSFPAQAAELEHGASVFDDVRYLRRPGTEQAYVRMRALDETLQATRPARLAELAELSR